MAAKWLIGFAILFGIATVMSNIIEYDATGGELVKGGIWGAINSFTLISFSGGVVGFLQGIWNLIVSAWAIIVALFGMFMWDYSFLQGDWALLRWLFFFPISLGVVISLLFALRGSSSA